MVDRFWVTNLVNDFNLDHVLFGQFHRIGITGWFFDLEGSSLPGYDDGLKDNENEDNENVDDRLGDDC
jgi:hypothetical protein